MCQYIISGFVAHGRGLPYKSAVVVLCVAVAAQP
jgi:hypothetical protein